MRWTNDYSGVLMNQVPVRNPLFGGVLLHAHCAGFKRMLCTVATGEKS